MRSRVPPSLTRREKEVLQEAVDKAVQEGIVRAQYLMILALNEAFGMGPERLGRCLGKYEEILEQYREAQKDDIAEELVKRRLVQIGWGR